MSGESWSDRLFGGFRKTSEKLTENLAGIVSKTRLDDAQLDDLEDALILSDLGPRAAARIREKLAAERFERGADEAASGRRRKKDDLRGIEIKIASQLAEPLPLPLVGAGEGNLPAVGGPRVELIEKPVALGFVQHQIASREIAERRRVEFEPRALLGRS